MSHYFSEKQTSPLQLQKLTATLRGKTFSFFTGSGVFSKNAIDEGTKLLIEHARLKPNSHALDLGCGYGPVGIVLATLYPTTTVLLSDINERAVHLAQANASLNNVRVRVIKSNVFSHIPDLFDIILLNPPQTAGKELCFRMIQEAKEHLRKNGELVIVARHNKGGKELSRKMKDVFENIREGAKHAGYRIYYSKK